MKRIKVIITIVFMLAMILPLILAGAENKSDIPELSPEEILNIKEQTPLLNLASTIKEKYSNEEYGGMYIDDNNNLNVFILPHKQEVKAFINESIDLCNVKREKVFYRTAQYSLAALLDEMDKLYDCILKNNIDCSEICLDESINRIRVFLTDEKALNDFVDDINMLNITKEENTDIERVKCATYTINSGSGASTSSQSFSVAFMAKLSNNDIGFVTAGHCISNGNKMYYGINSSS